MEGSFVQTELPYDGKVNHVACIVRNDLVVHFHLICIPCSKLYMPKVPLDLGLVHGLETCVILGGFGDGPTLGEFVQSHKLVLLNASDSTDLKDRGTARSQTER